MSDLFAIGKIRTSHGLKGFVKVLSFSGEYKHFRSLKDVYLEKNGNKKLYSVEKVEGSGSSTVLKLFDIDSPEVAKKLSNCEIWVDRKYVSNCSKNEFYYADLMGCSILFDGSCVGEIVGFIDNSADTLIEVKKESGKVVLIPFNRHFIGKVDISKKFVELLDECVLDED